MVSGPVVSGPVAWRRGGPLRRAQGRVEQAERVPGQPGQGVPHAGELAAAGASGVPVPAGGAADRAPLALRGLVGQLLRGRGLPDIFFFVLAAAPAAERGLHPARDLTADALGTGPHQPPLEIANRVAARLSAHTGRVTPLNLCVVHSVPVTALRHTGPGWRGNGRR